MNTLGKILVVLNLLFALVVGGFVVFTYATRFRYDQALEQQKNEVRAVKAYMAGADKVLADLDAKYKNALVERDKAKYTLSEAESLWKAEKTRLEDDVKEKLNELNSIKVALREKEEEIKRRNVEVENLTIFIKQRDEKIVELEGKYRVALAAEVAQRLRADSLQARNDSLLAENKRLQLLLLKDRTGSGGTGIKLAHEPNPPPALVKGAVAKVDSKNPDVVELNVGSDHGLELNHTLEAYRMEPDATYLGMIRIVEVHHHTAIGRLERSSISRRVPLRSGDRVISDLKAR